ncbi:MAG: CocE/NonD family hydrolase [Flavobacteriales bacterium]
MKNSIPLKFILCCLITFPFAGTVVAQLDWTEVEIPMGDDSTLEADIYLPDSWTSGPVILIQTPYNKNLYHFGLPIGIGQNQSGMEYAIVIVDWRGFWGSSDAAYSGSPTGGQDGYSCVQWIASQTWCDGNVGSWGPSALGNIQFQTAAQNPPNLKCIAPLVASPQFDYLDYYPGGALRTEYVEQLDNLGFGISPLIISNPYQNFLWTLSESLNYYPDQIEVPALMMGGWYDHNVETMLHFFQGLQNESPADVQDKHRLVMGPWGHGGNGTASMGGEVQGELEYPNAAGWSDSLVWVFFDHYLKNIDNGWDDTPTVQFYQMGLNAWQTSNAWPTADTQPVSLFLHSTGELNTQMPTDASSITLEYNPNDPSPTIGGPTLRSDLEQGPYDQAPLVESRNDILIFDTNVLLDNVTMRGKATVHLKVSSTTSDTDFTARLCDVYPDGRSMFVCDGAFRMRFKNGYEQADESFMEPGEVYDCIIEFPNTAITFLAGHQIRLDITSSNYPRFNRNMNTGAEMYPNVNGDTLVSPIIATNTVHTASINASFLSLPLVDGFPSSIHNALVESTHRIYPQPANDLLHITLPEDIALPVDIELYTQNGQLVKRDICTSESWAMDVGMIASGVYILKIVTSHNSVHAIVEIQH